ncbi:GYF domain-containing protein [Planctomicrobium sp. SH664]|uniref:GYF domain-containing protein n=1 Tax=Planctomicrobium sp. SH664 TaxID=3448125 RepID=UPI003F5C22BD
MSDLMSGRHFVRINGKVLGPFEMDQLRSLRDRGRLHADHEISTDRRKWEPVSRLEGLFEAPRSAPAKTKLSDEMEAITAAENESSEKGWFYSRDGVQDGPVTLKRLRKLAREGTLKPDDLIWRDGMSEWVAAADEESLTFGTSKSGVVRDAGQSTGQTPIWDALLGAVREMFQADSLERFYVTFLKIGGISMTVVALIWAVFSVIVAIKLDSLESLLWGAIGVAGIATAKYVAVQLAMASDELIKSTPNTLSSVRFLSTVAARCLLVAFSLSAIGFFYVSKFSAGILNWNTIDERWFIIAFAIQFPLSALFTAVSALQPGSLNISIQPGARAGYEGIAVRFFNLKLFARFAAFWFGTGAVLGVVAILWGLVQINRGETYIARGIGAATFGAALACGAVAVPCLAYYLLTRLSINLEVKQAILAVAAREK